MFETTQLSSDLSIFHRLVTLVCIKANDPHFIKSLEQGLSLLGS